MSYVGDLIRWSGAEDAITLALAPGAQTSGEYRLFVEPIEKTRTVRVIEQSVCRMDDVIELAQRTNAELTVLPSGDEFSLPLAIRGWRGPGCVSVLIMRLRPQGKTQVIGIARSLIKLLALTMISLRKSTRAHYLASAVQTRRSMLPSISDPIDYSPTKFHAEALTRKWQMRTGVKYLGIFGAISDRKNVPMVIEAAERLGDQTGVILAGSLSAGVRKYVDGLTPGSLATHLIVDDRLLSAGELDSAVGMVHALVAAHSNEGPSGLVGKALAAGTIVVGAGAASIKRDVDTIGRPSVWSPLTISGLETSFRFVLSQSKPGSRRLPDSQAFARKMLGR